MHPLSKYWQGLLHMFFPRLCLSCDEPLVRGEDLVCSNCLYQIGRTNYHMDEANPVAQLFYGRIDIEFGTSYFQFDKGGIFQKLMHQLKYKDMSEVGDMLGKHLGMGLKASPYLPPLDVIIPVPLHPKKEKKRGYNQSYHIALGIAEVMNVAVDKRSLRRVVYKGSQTQLSREKRWENVADNFKVKGASLTGKHVLLVDDVLTTGATIEACYNALKEVEGIRVSVATLARAQ